MGRDQEAVQSYLNDLLTEMPAGRSADPHEPLTSTAGMAAAVKSRSTVSMVALQEQVHSLEVVKRQQLQALLDRPAPAQVEEPIVVPLVTPEAVTPVAPPVVEPKPVAEPKLVVEPKPFVEPEPVVEPEPAPVETASPLLQWCDNGRPVWAQQKFDVLLFKVSGLTLAVPLIALGQIHLLTDGLTPIFGQADWFMGLQPTSAGRIRTVNTALFVMPERYDPAFLQSARYVVTIDGLDWGLAVDEVQQPTRLSPDDVTWRSERSKRPWLAGTVKAAMCALLDIPQMGRVLQSHDRKRAGATSR